MFESHYQLQPGTFDHQGFRVFLFSACPIKNAEVLSKGRIPVPNLDVARDGKARYTVAGIEAAQKLPIAGACWPIPEAPQKALRKTQEKNNRVQLAVPVGKKNAHAESRGERANVFIIRTVDEAMERGGTEDSYGIDD